MCTNLFILVGLPGLYPDGKSAEISIEDFARSFCIGSSIGFVAFGFGLLASVINKTLYLNE